MRMGATEGTGKELPFGLGALEQLSAMVKDEFRPVDDHTPRLGDFYGMGITVEDTDVQLVFQLPHHQAKGGLRDTARFSGRHEISATVHSYNIFQLLKRHNIDYFNTNIEIIVLINITRYDIFAPGETKR